MVTNLGLLNLAVLEDLDDAIILPRSPELILQCGFRSTIQHSLCAVPNYKASAHSHHPAESLVFRSVGRQCNGEGILVRDHNLETSNDLSLDLC